MPTRGLQPYEKVDRDIARRYAIGKRLGRGCYGVVWEAWERVVPFDEEGRHVALKKVLHAFRDSVDAQRTYREVAYLLEFGAHENILAIHDVLCSHDDRHLYIVSDLFDSDLQKALRVNCLKPVHKPLIGYQLLRALKYIHSAGVMHRDVKPSNVLINSKCEIALADFGWARAAPAVDTYDGLMTDYAATRWYRAPELLLGARQYGTPVDMWALGCLVGELHRDKALIPGTSTVDMLGLIVEVLGKPVHNDVLAMRAPYASFSLDCLPPGPPHNPLDKSFPGETPQVIDFTKLCLQWNPHKRFSAAEACEHPYLDAFRNPCYEPIFGRKVTLPLPETERLPASAYRDQIYAEVVGLEDSKRRIEEARRAREYEMEQAGMRPLLAHTEDHPGSDSNV